MGITRAHEVPLVEALARGETRVQDGHVVAEARAEAAHGLGRERDLGNEDERALALRADLLDGIEVDLGLAGSGDAVHEHAVAACARDRVADGGEGTDLSVGELLGPGGTGARESRSHGPAHAAAVGHGHGTVLLERLDCGSGAADEGRELGEAHRAGGERLEHAALTRGGGFGLVGGVRELDPAVVHGAGLVALELPGAALVRAGDLDLLARREEGAHRLGERAGVLAREPRDHAGGDLVEGRRREDPRDVLDLLGIDACRRIGGKAHHIAHGGAMRERHEHGRADDGLIRQLGRDAVIVGTVERARGYVEDDAGVGHGSPIGFCCC